MYELYATGSYSLEDLAVYANKEGLRSRKGCKLQKCTIHKMLKNPIYYGDFHWNNKIYKGRHKVNIFIIVVLDTKDNAEINQLKKKL